MAIKIINDRGKDVTPAEHKIVVKLAKECLRELSKKKYEMPGFDGSIVIQTKNRRQRSYGGRSGICIDINQFRKNELMRYEYQAYKDDPIIGDAEFKTATDALRMTVAHEVSHFVQFKYKYKLPDYLKKHIDKPHGKGFKKIYRYLRVGIVNQNMI